MKKCIFLIAVTLTFFLCGYSNVYADENEKNESVECTYANYKIIYNTNGGNSISSLSVDINTTNVSLSTPTREGYTFDGWYYDASYNNVVNSSNIVNIVKPDDCKDAYVNIYAKWIENKKDEEVPTSTDCSYNEYSIRFDSTGGVQVETVKYKITQTSVNLPTPTREGYTFEGWYYDASYNNLVNSNNIVNINKPEDCSIAYVNMYAKWKQNIENPTNDNSTSEVDSSSLSHSSSSKTCDYSSYYIYFNTNGGNKINKMNVRTTQNYVGLPTPKKDGYVFLGWYYDKSFNSKVNITNATKLSNIVKPEDCSRAYVNLYARWVVEEKKCTYNGFDVIFNVNGGSELEKITVNSESTNTSIPETKKDGFQFGGWYYDSELTWKVETDNINNLANVTSPEDCSNQYVNLYAKWVTIIDSSDVSVLLLEGMSDDIKSMRIENVSDVSKYSNYKEISDSNYVVYEIDLLDSNGKKIQPSRRVTVSINVPANLDKNNLIVYLVDDDKLIPYDVIVEEKDNQVKAYFDTDHFSTYILSENIVLAPKTSKKFIIMAIVSAILLVCTVLIAIKYRKSN